MPGVAGARCCHWCLIGVRRLWGVRLTGWRAGWCREAADPFLFMLTFLLESGVEGDAVSILLCVHQDSVTVEQHGLRLIDVAKGHHTHCLQNRLNWCNYYLRPLQCQWPAFASCNLDETSAANKPSRGRTMQSFAAVVWCPCPSNLAWRNRLPAATGDSIAK